MSLFYDTSNPDSLEMLLRKAHAIHTVNKENIEYIQARKGQQVILKHQYSLETKPHSSKKQKTQYMVNQDDDLFQLVDKATTRGVDEIVATWSYLGQPLTKESIAIDDFMNRTLIRYYDLLRLHDEYGGLLDKYSRILTDVTESRIAVEIVMRNLEILQVAIGEIHAQVLDEVDSMKVNDAVMSLMKDLSKSVASFQSKASGLGLNIDVHSRISENIETDGVLEFSDCRALKCKYTLSEHTRAICALQPYVLNNKQYLASASGNKTIRLWDLSGNSLVATLYGHTRCIRAMVLYVHNGIHMLASASDDRTIKLWNLSQKNKVKTLHDNWTSSLAVYKENCKTILISGSQEKTIELWDIDIYTTIRTLHGHEGEVRTLCVYNHGDKPYLASGSTDRSIKIWSLRDYTLINNISEDVGFISPLLIVDYRGTQTLACGDNDGKIKLRSLDNYQCIKTIDAHTKFIRCLDVIKCNGKICLVSGSNDNTIEVWDLQSNSRITGLNNYKATCSLKAFMNGDRACLANGDDYGKIKLWME